MSLYDQYRQEHPLELYNLHFQGLVTFVINEEAKQAIAWMENKRPTTEEAEKAVDEFAKAVAMRGMVDVMRLRAALIKMITGGNHGEG